MYHIYYVKGIKVGCTNNIIKRVEKMQGYTEDEYTILESTPCIKTAGELELFHQKRLGYKVDKIRYDKLKRNIMKIRVDDDTVTFGKKGDIITKERLLDSGKIEKKGKVLHDIIISDTVADWILKHLQPSQYNLGSYVYIKTLMKEFTVDTIEEEYQESKFSLIRTWARERGLYEKGDDKTQYVKLMEEAGELAKALLKDDEEEIIDAIGDIVVVLTNLSHLRGYKIEDCIDSAYDVISKRTGKMINGTFVKDNK